MGQQREPDTWAHGRAYEAYVGRWSRQVAPRFLEWLHQPPGLRWLDVGCGTGALSAAILEVARPATVDGVDPSEGFLEAAVVELGTRVTFHRASAEALPVDDASMDVVVSGLALNFVPDPERGLAEMTRVAVDGGVVAAYVWDYAERMELMRRFWEAAVEIDPGAAAVDEGARFSDLTPEGLTWRFAGAGLLEDLSLLGAGVRYGAATRVGRLTGGRPIDHGYSDKAGQEVGEDATETKRRRSCVSPRRRS